MVREPPKKVENEESDQLLQENPFLQGKGAYWTTKCHSTSDFPLIAKAGKNIED